MKDTILQEMVQIIDEADTVQEVLLEPAAAGLDIICHGIRLISESDQAALEKGYMIYEALYAHLANKK